MTDIIKIDEKNKAVHYDNGTMITHKDFLIKLKEFFSQRIAGETLVPSDMERFMSRTSSKNLKLLMKGKKMEGYLEGSLDKFLTKGQKIALATVVTIVMVAVIAIVILKNQGIF